MGKPINISSKRLVFHYNDKTIIITAKVDRGGNVVFLGREVKQ